jgi:putative endonuclease
MPAKAGIQNNKNMIDKNPCVYIIASKRNGTLYTGVTSHLIRRITQHKQEVIDGFTKKYGVHILVWYELHQTMESAILREKCIKEWKRSWKIRLIMEVNPGWHDLYNSILV